MSPVPLLATRGMDGDAMTKSETALVYTSIGTTWKDTAMARLTIMQDQRDEIRSLQDRISAMTSAPLRDGQSVADFIAEHSVTCDCCDHVMIDVTAARAGGEQHCVAGDPEGDGMGCAHSWRETVVTLEAEGDQLRAKVEVLEAALRSQDVQVKALRAERDQARAQVESAHQYTYLSRNYLGAQKSP